MQMRTTESDMRQGTPLEDLRSMFYAGRWGRGMYFFVVSILAGLFALSASAQSSFPPPIWASQVPGSFIRLAESDLAALTPVIPDINIAEGVDTTGWVEYDVTTAGGTGRLSSCANMDNTGSSDNSRAFSCMMQNIGDNALLYFPDGTYDFGTPLNGISVFRPDSNYDNRGIRCQSRGAVLNTTGDYRNPVTLMESEDIERGPATSWNGGAGGRRGETVLRVGSTSAFTAGGWVYLYANSNGVQDRANRHYYTKISSIGANTITIDRPLPDDFDGGGATAAPWFPAENLVLENCTLQYENPDHQQMYFNFLLSWKSVGGGHIKNVHFHSSYQYQLLLADVARVLIAQTDFSDMHWDKPFNGYSISASHISDVTIMDGHMEGSPQNIACGASGLGTVIAFMDIRGSVPNQPAFDRGCNEGSGNSCRQVDHGHPLHCSSNTGDIQGDSGDSSCRGTRADVNSGSILFHNAACSQTSVIRSYIEPQIWVDFYGGPGRNNFFYGNTLRAGNTISADGAAGSPGDFVTKDMSSDNGGYRQNFIWANNTIRNFGVWGGFNYLGDGIQVLDTVIRGQCFYNNSSGQGADGGACTSTNQGPGGRNTVFTNNTVGANAHPGSYSRVMPSAPGFTDWSMLVGADSSSPPYVGPEMGDPEQSTSCLPAAVRWYGSCPD